MESSLFARLPPELRNPIWMLVLSCPEPIYIRETVDSNRELTHSQFRIVKESDPARRHPLALQRSCKQIAAECGQLFYMHNHFVLLSGAAVRKRYLRSQLPLNVRLLENFVTHIGPESANVLCDVEVHLGHTATQSRASNQSRDPNHVQYSVVYALCWLEQFAFRHPHCKCVVTLHLHLQLSRYTSMRYSFDLRTIKQCLEEEAASMEENAAGVGLFEFHNQIRDYGAAPKCADILRSWAAAMAGEEAGQEHMDALLLNIGEL